MISNIQIQPLGFPWETRDPFLFCAYHRDEYPAGNGKMGVDAAALRGRRVGSDFVVKDGWRMYHGSSIPGFPYHPHRGFETITINKEGFVDHTDSMGAAGRFGAGDVQWMTAGKGVQHSEMFPLLYEDKKNPLEIFQIWLNLPRASKMVDPHFKMLWKEDIPKIQHKDITGKTTTIDLVAGSLGDYTAQAPSPDSWAATPDNQVVVLTLEMEPGARWTIPAAEGELNRSLYFYRGNSLQLGSLAMMVDYMAHLPTTEITIENGAETGFLLFLQGRPIKEPVAQHGPFVMNTMEEIQQAFSEYRRTEFGGWPWPDREQVHPRAKGRFALYGNGKEEIKETS